MGDLLELYSNNEGLAIGNVPVTYLEAKGTDEDGKPVAFVIGNDSSRGELPPIEIEEAIARGATFLGGRVTKLTITCDNGEWSMPVPFAPKQ